jgi:hypothetical protein
MSKQIDNGGSVTADLISERYVAGLRMLEQKVKSVGGLSIRDYFAAAALQGLLATHDISKIHPVLREKYKVEHMPIIAGESYKLADAMLAARKEGGQP